MSPGAPWAHIAAGGDHTCGIRGDGTLWCWGDNTYGQLGLGSHIGQDLPRQVTSPARGGWARIVADFEDTCAIRTDGTLWCWGDNGFGELGIGNDTSQDRPTQVTTPAPRGWASITTSDDHTCATRTGGTLWCWGVNEYGQLGIGNHTIRTGHAGQHPGSGWLGQRHRRRNHTCATRTDATLWCWGENDHGQLGIGSHAAPGPAAAGHHPGPGRLGQRHRRQQRTPALPAPAAPCGAGATTTRASSASATTPARTGRSRSPPRPRAAGPASPPASTTPAPPAPAPPCGAGATTTTASSASAATPARTCRGRSPAAAAAGQRNASGYPGPDRRHPCWGNRNGQLGLGIASQDRPAGHRLIVSQVG